MVTTFKPGTDLEVGDMVHPAEGEPSAVTAVMVLGRRVRVTLANGTMAELTADDVVEVESARVIGTAPTERPRCAAREECRSHPREDGYCLYHTPRLAVGGPR